MKFYVLILFISLTTASAKSSYSQNAKFTFDLENVSVKELFSQIEKSSEFIFVYYDNIIDLNKEVSVKASNETVEEILEKVFKSSDNTYKIFDRQIVIAKKEGSSGTMEAFLAEQQKKELKGTVTDEKGTPLPGVSVVVKGTTVGIITDGSGNFSLLVPTDAKTVVFSFVGMKSQEHPIGTKSTFTIKMEVQATGLSEVVAIGYGTRTKRDVTSAISTISKDAIDKSVSMSSELAMQGRMTGVQVVGGGGNPMSRPTIRIRGVNTWGVASPLYIIDGVPVTEFGAGIEGQEDPRAADVRGPLNIMTMVDPNDIESISVLKDASAAAVYGVRAANGVILITTKKGRGDRPVVEFSSRVGVQNITQKTNLLDTPQYTKFLSQVMASDPTIAMNTDNVGLFDAASPKYLGNSATYNWQDALKRPNGMLRDNTVRVSGGTSKTDYFVSVGSTKNEGAFRYNYLDRLSGSFKVNTQVNDWLKVGANFRITSGKGKDFNPDLVQAGQFPAWQKIYDPNGLYGYASTVVGRKSDGSYSSEKLFGNGTRVNMLGNVLANDVTYNSMRNMGSVYLEIEPIKHLKIKGQMSMDVYNFTRYTFNDNDGSIFDYTSGDKTVLTGGNSVGSYEERDVFNNNYINEINVNYNNTFGKHNLDVVFNGSDQQYNAKYKSASTQWMQSKLDYMRRLGGESKYLSTSSDLTNSALQGLMGRVSYNYNSTYYLDVTVRHDGSTRFSKEKRWGTFPSISGAWRISKESFMENIKFINDLKIRAGYGQLGNQEVRDMAYLSPIDNRPIFAWGVDAARIGMGNKYVGAAVFSLANANLQWEKTSTKNIGIDATVLDNKLSVSLEYYNKLTDGILQTVTLPPSLGLIQNPVDNIASVRNSGVELSMNFNNNIGELKYSIGANFSTVKNVVEKTSGHIPIGTIEEGYSMNYIKGYRVGGIFQTQAEVDAWKAKYADDTYQAAKIAPGDFYYQDQRSAPTKPNTFYKDSLDNKINSYDQVYLGKTIPGFYYGVNLNLEYKNFDLSANFTGLGDVQRVNVVKQTLYNTGTTNTNASVDVLNAWTAQNHSTTMPRVINGDPAGNYRLSDRFVESGAYLRLSNVQLGFSLPEQVYNLLHNSISNCRIYVGAANVFTLTKYSGYDPENDNYPTPKTMFLGLNVRF